MSALYSCLVTITALSSWHLLPRVCGFWFLGSLFHCLINPMVERLLILYWFRLLSPFEYLVAHLFTLHQYTDPAIIVFTNGRLSTC